MPIWRLCSLILLYFFLVQIYISQEPLTKIKTIIYEHQTESDNWNGSNFFLLANKIT